MNIKLQTNEQLSATVANGLAGVFINGVSLSANLSGKADLTSLQNYYIKTDTSSANEISNELKKYQLSGNYLSSNALDNYYQKSETSSATEISTALANAGGGKVYFDNRISSITGSNDLSVVKLSADEYAQMLDDGTCLSNAIYIVEAPNIDAFKQRITNVAPGTNLSDAVNLAQLNAVSANAGTITGITMNGTSKGTSGVVNLGTVLTAHQSLSNCLQNNSSYDSINLTATSGIRLASDVRIDNGYGFTVKDDYQDSYTTVNLTGISVKEQIEGELDDQTNIGAASINMSTLQPNQQPPSELFKSITFTTKTNNTSQTSSLADLIYTKTETSSATEISTALANAGGGSGQLSTKLDSSAAWPAWVNGESYDYKQIVSHNGKLWKANAPFPEYEPGSSQATDWLSVDINSILTSQYQTKGNYLTAVPTTYKTYSQTIAALSNDGYATSAQVNQKSTVSFNRITTSGTNIGSITIDGTTTQIYAPTSGGGGGSSVQVSADYQTGTRVATISVDNVPTSIYVPNGGGGGSSVQVSANYQSGINIATISVDNVPTSIYVPNSSGGSSRYALVTAQLVSDSGSLTCAVDDQTITTIQVSSSTTPIVVQLPAQPANGARDFILRIEISSSTAPTFTFNGVNETIDFDSEDADWAVMEPGLNLVSFTETKRGN